MKKMPIMLYIGMLRKGALDILAEQMFFLAKNL